MNSTIDLRKVLFETITDLRSGAIDHNRANAISKLSGEILKSAKLDLDVMEAAQRLGAAHATPVPLTHKEPKEPRLEAERPSLESEQSTLIYHFFDGLPYAECQLIRDSGCKTALELAKDGRRLMAVLGAKQKNLEVIARWLEDRFNLTMET